MKRFIATSLGDAMKDAPVSVRNEMYGQGIRDNYAMK